MKRSTTNPGRRISGILRVSKPDCRLCAGLMSGTSMDGVDAALVEISGPSDRPRVRMRAFASLPYPPALRARLMRGASGCPVTTGEISELNFLVGESFAHAALLVCRRAGVRPEDLVVIGSHGQTIFHQGKAVTALETGANPSTIPSTLQIGEPAVIAQRTGAPVVADFRAADMAAGGEGAPLAPLVDYLLLRHRKTGTIALNIGGIANITVIKAGARQEDVYGFDTGPGNMVIDELVRRVTNGKESYDLDGSIGSKGAIDHRVVDKILQLAFFSRRPPKSAGREQFGSSFVDQFFKPKRDSYTSQQIATATELTARSIALAIQSWIALRRSKWRLVVSGGGSHNRFLLARIAAHLPAVPILQSDDFGLPVDAKESIAFAILADRTMHGLPGNLPRVTGASRTVVLGKLARS